MVLDEMFEENSVRTYKNFLIFHFLTERRSHWRIRKSRMGDGKLDFRGLIHDSHFLLQAIMQRKDSGLGVAVRDQSRRTEETSHGSCSDYMALFILDHRRQESLQSPVLGNDIHVIRAVDRLFRGVEHAVLETYSCVVDENARVAVLFADASGEIHDFLALGEVAFVVVDLGGVRHVLR